ncbi:MAG: cupin domain-containing protein [Verrucomicrobiaceae bacterium]|nr:MAG: cupin domain-containing protein [Verrucomicrobiaceae bacterium]
MPPAVRSLQPPAGNGDAEVVTPILEGRSFRAEHISSFGNSSAPDFWYDQDRPEWVALLQGTASIEFADGTVHLKAGDCLVIPAHVRHRVSATSADATWFALHFEP